MIKALEDAALKGQALAVCLVDIGLSEFDVPKGWVKPHAGVSTAGNAMPTGNSDFALELYRCAYKKAGQKKQPALKAIRVLLGD
ncbi:MAG: hypothetical protein WBB01_09225 [Phormidesmis sp.]